jgi:hypothetical protein
MVIRPEQLSLKRKHDLSLLQQQQVDRFNPAHIKYIDEKIPEDSYLWLEQTTFLIQTCKHA